MTWRDERRKDRAAEARRRRSDQTAAVEAEIRLADATADRRRADVEHQAQLRAQADRDRVQRRRERDRTRLLRRQRRAAAWSRARQWAGGHVVDLLIYPLAAVSAVMAIPAMASFGHDVYGDATGYALPVITELGMWAFAIAVQYTHHHRPDRPVWALQLGVWVFAAVAAGLNFAHGVTALAPVLGIAQGTVLAGVVMAVASVAGVMAHQLVTAAPRRSRAERATLRATRAAARKVTRVRQAALREAHAHVGDNGAVRLVVVPGHYALRSRWATWFGRAPLAPAVIPGLPVEPLPIDGDWDEFDRFLADPEGFGKGTAGVDPTPDRGVDPTAVPGTIDTLDPMPGIGSNRPIDRGVDRHVDQQESTPTRTPDRSQDRGNDRPKDRGATRSDRPHESTPRGRSIDELRVELKAAIADGRLDQNPSAEKIRTTLRISPKRAAQLRDERRGA